MYIDKLDGRIDASFFQQKAKEWHAEQDRILRSIEEHQQASRSYIEEGVRILELAGNAFQLFKKQTPSEKRRLLGFLLSNCTWKHGELTADFRQPFGMIADTAVAYAKKKAAGVASDSLFQIW